MAALVASARTLDDDGCRSGWYRDWRRRNSRRRERRSIGKWPVGGGPSGRVSGKKE